MYHYVRDRDSKLPFFQSLNLDDFRRQLDYFHKSGGFVTREQLNEAIAGGSVADGFVLTFDDGVIDHYRFVLPELKKRGLFGIFYIPTGHYYSGELLDVHRIHYLLGRMGGVAMMDALGERVRPEMLSHEHVREFQKSTYSRQTNDSATTEFKRVFNYYISPVYRGPLLKELLTTLVDEQQLAREFYLSTAQLLEMQREGMVIGAHSVTHPVMSKLTEEEQAKEINDSFGFLEHVTGGLCQRTFCFPYGGRHSFNDLTLNLLTKANCRFALDVDGRPATEIDFKRNLLMLPRFDCNQFPFGQVRPY
jgi:peptidoglycan/xylan/chitin deacetylase (PgdA/CDA1 family)